MAASVLIVTHTKAGVFSAQRTHMRYAENPCTNLRSFERTRACKPSSDFLLDQGWTGKRRSYLHHSLYDAYIGVIIPEINDLSNPLFPAKLKE